MKLVKICITKRHDLQLGCSHMEWEILPLSFRTLGGSKESNAIKRMKNAGATHYYATAELADDLSYEVTYFGYIEGGEK